MSMIFMNSDCSTTFDVHRLKLNATDKIDLQRVDNCVALSEYLLHTEEYKKVKSCKNNMFKISGIAGGKEFELSDGSFPYQIFKIILSTSSRSMNH